MARTYKISRFRSNDGAYVGGTLTIPSDILKVIPEDSLFTVELTDEGILYRAATEETMQVKVPEWVKQNGTS